MHRPALSGIWTRSPLREDWEDYTDLGKPVPNQELMNKSATVSIDGIADTGCTVLCCGLEVMRKLWIPRSVLISSNISP